MIKNVVLSHAVRSLQKGKCEDRLLSLSKKQQKVNPLNHSCA